MLSSCTWSTRLVPEHALCSILCILDFRPASANQPIKKAISDVSRSPPNRRRRRPTDDDHPPSKRRASEYLASTSGSNETQLRVIRQAPENHAVTSCGIQVNTVPRVAYAPYHEPTFDESLMLEKESIETNVEAEAELELSILYDEAEYRDACAQHAAEVAEDCSVAFEILNQFENEETENDEEHTQPQATQDTVSVQDMAWDHNADLINLHSNGNSSSQNISSTPTRGAKTQGQIQDQTVCMQVQKSDDEVFDESTAKKLIEWNKTLNETASFERPNDSPPSSAPSYGPESGDTDEVEQTTQLTLVVQDGQTEYQFPKPLTPADKRSVPLLNFSDNAVDGKYILHELFNVIRRHQDGIVFYNLF